MVVISGNCMLIGVDRMVVGVDDGATEMDVPGGNIHRR